MVPGDAFWSWRRSRQTMNGTRMSERGEEHDIREEVRAEFRLGLGKGKWFGLPGGKMQGGKW